MKLKKQLKPISFFLILIMLLQSCTVYRSANVSLPDAVEANTKVKIKQTDGSKLKFSRIVLQDDNQYYGVERKKINNIWQDTNPILIQEGNIDKIQIKNEFLSVLFTFLLPLSPIILWVGGVATLMAINH